MDVDTIPGLPVLPVVVSVDVGTWVVGIGPSTVQVYLSIIIHHIHGRQLHTVLTLPLLSGYTAGWVARMSGITIQYIAWCNCYFTLRNDQVCIVCMYMLYIYYSTIIRNSSCHSTVHPTFLHAMTIWYANQYKCLPC